MTKQAPMLNAPMTEMARATVWDIGHWCFGFVWSLVIGAWSLDPAAARS